MPAAHLRQILDKPLLALPDLTMLSWSFDPSLIIPFLIASLCTSVKTIGNLTTCQKINDADWKRPDMPNLKKGLLADGMSVSISGLLGGMGQSTASSNIGLSVGTGATSRQIAFATGGILIGLAFLPRFAEIFVVMPQPVMGATPLFAVCFIIFTGLQIMMSRMMDPRKIFILGISMIFGLSVTALLNVYSQVQIPWLRPIFASSLYLSTLLAIGLTVIFQIGLKKKVSHVLTPDKTTYEYLANLMEKQGALWGARQGVITQATHALNELLELIVVLDLTKKHIGLEMMFDEFNLDLTLQYDGKPLALTNDYVEPLSVDADISITQLALRLIRKDADEITVSEKDGQPRIVLHFEH